VTQGAVDERAMVCPERIEGSLGSHLTGDLGLVERLATIVGDRELERLAGGELGPGDHPGVQELGQQTTDRLRRQMDTSSHVRPTRPGAARDHTEHQELTRRQSGVHSRSVQPALDEATELDHDEGQWFTIRAGRAGAHAVGPTSRSRDGPFRAWRVGTPGSAPSPGNATRATTLSVRTDTLLIIGMLLNGEEARILQSGLTAL
jgi:hypothetical protein